MTLGPGVWLALGAVLAVLEVVVPGVLLLWLGLAAGATAACVAVVPELGWPAQLLAFAGWSGVAVAAGLAVERRSRHRRPDSGLNQRGQACVGATAVLLGPMAGGEGRLRLGDSVWPARGLDLPDGSRVRIVAAEGALLHVEPAPLL